VNPLLRLFAATLLALMLPVQGFAAACAQICAAVEQQRHAQMMATMADGAEGEQGAGHCGESSTQGAGKCCKAHSFLIDLPIVAIDALPSFQEATCFVAHWTSFFPEEPSPPPIPAVSIA
jgi:hypothetical protein